ncbi:HisA/HisF-related TIM barrel protein [Methylopila musalis]|uniref:HisA/HisF-related TIM barrel protein n=1 Tax=Methylopila musalis TaxID=1134781 RepID=A0ABW3Z8U9_9HYPH
MDVIPVIDLMDGRVVHARRGERGAYRPIASPFAPGAEPLATAAALLALAPFRALYVADLDAILNRGGHDDVIAAIAAAHPGVEIWVDRGAAAGRAGAPIVGTESHADACSLSDALTGDAILSLDHDADGPLGPVEVHDQPDRWPRRVIAMTLARVGAGAGPDLGRLAEVLAKAGPERAVYAAGGVRGEDDLAALASLGVAGALVATALHDGRICADAVRRLAKPSPRTPPRR